MNGIVLGVAMLVSSVGVSPNQEAPRTTIVPAAFTFDLPDITDTSHNRRHRFLNDQSRPLWRRGPLQQGQASSAKQCSNATRIIAVVAGAFGGWMAGGIVGGYATAKRDDDGASAMRGVMIGAPIGAVVGGVMAFRLTK